MKTNTFYNPKNQYNEPLASTPYVDAISGSINNKLNTFNTIKVKWINSGRGDNKFTDIKEYFVSLMDPSSPYYMDKEDLKIELGQTIYIIDKTVGTYVSWQEWICRYPNFEEQNENYNGYKIPLMIRLGNADSNLARHDIAGTVQLVHDLYEVEDWSEFLTKDYKGRLTTNPIEGKAVAPYALEAFVNADNEIRARLNRIEAEIEGSTLGDEVGFQNSRLGRLESIIGINGTCTNCGCDTNCSCNNANNKCTIFCRLNDAEDDLNSHMETLEEHHIQISTNTETIAEEIERAKAAESAETERAMAAEEAINNKLGPTPAENEIWYSAIWPNIVSIEDIIGRRDSSSEDTIWEAIDKYRGDINGISADIGKSGSTNTDTVWGSINAISTQIGNSDDNTSGGNTGNNGPTSRSIWSTINALSTQIGNIDSINSNNLWGSTNNNKNVINDLSTQIGSKDSTDPETIWGAINTYKSSASDDIDSNEIQILAIGDFQKLNDDNICTITVSKLLENESASSTEWSNVNVSSVKIKRPDGTMEVIYPYILYKGAINGQVDNRKIEVIYNEGESNTEVEILINAFKSISKRIVKAE